MTAEGKQTLARLGKAICVMSDTEAEKLVTFAEGMAYMKECQEGMRDPDMTRGETR